LKKDERKQAGQRAPCPIQQETVLLITELWFLGQSQFLQIMQDVLRGNTALALGSIRVARRQFWSCDVSLRLLERVSQLAYATICPHEAEELKKS